MLDGSKTPIKKMDIVQIAKKKRHLDILSRLQQGRPLSRKDVEELKGYENDMAGNFLKTPEDVAEKFAVSKRTIYRWIDAGMPGQPGKYVLSDIQVWKNSIKKDGAEKSGARVDWGARYREAKARREERLNAVEEGKLIPIADVEKQLISVCVAMKARLLAISKSVAPKLEGEAIRVREKIISDEVRWAINDIASDKIFKHVLGEKISIEKCSRVKKAR